jgi:hypothetical protein
MKTIYENAEIITDGRVEIGEVYPFENIDFSEGWGCFHYGFDHGYEGMESKKEAESELRRMDSEYRGSNGVETETGSIGLSTCFRVSIKPKGRKKVHFLFFDKAKADKFALLLKSCEIHTDINKG